MSKKGRPPGLLHPENYTHIGKYAINEPNFFSNLIRDGDCLLWRKGTHVQGYGMVSIYNNLTHSRQMNVAHRVAMMLFMGRELDRKEFVVHKLECNNMLCCNPHHLILGDATDRNRICYERGNKPTKTKGPNAIKKQQRQYKHTDEEMRFYRDNPTDVSAEHFGVTRRQAAYNRWRYTTGYKWLK